MAPNPAVTCPKCDKKFKPKAEVKGKKIKCPYCLHAFAVPGGKEEKDAKPAKVKASEAKAKPEEPKPAAPVEPEAAEKPPVDSFESDPDPYGVKTQDLTPRCPVCATEMASANAIICLKCGYNTLTRVMGKTEKTLGVTTQQHFMHLLPALGAAGFTFFAVVFLLYYALVSPFHVEKTMFEFTDTEAIRMWTTVIFLGWIWGAGSFCFKKFFEEPMPDEISLE